MSDEPRHLTLTRPALLRLLDTLDALDEPAARTVYAPSGTPLPAEADEAASTAYRESATGAVTFWGSAARLIVAAPFPVEEAASLSGYATARLRELLTRPRALGVVLVRLGGYAAGVYRDGAFTVTKTGGRFVKNRHRKGGQSQRRFERIREGQMREHFDDVAEVIRSRLLPEVSTLDALVLGGDRHTVQALLSRAPLPPPLAAKLLPRVIDAPEPRHDVLLHSPVAIWSSRVLIVREPERPL